MKPRKIKDGIHWVGAVDWERRLFDSLIPLPDGTSYNAYLIQGSQKTALIDTVDPTMEGLLMEQLEGLGVKTLDYVIANHAEQDHSGAIPCVLDRYPQAKLLVTPEGKDVFRNLLLIPEERITTVDDRSTLSLGNRTLEFISFPWVHWPETMLTYLKEDRILFPCDLFGSHLATTDLYVSDQCQVYEAAKRYYAEIMMPFRLNIKTGMKKLEGCDIDIIAPSHGPMYDDPKFIMNAYRDWTSDEVANTVVLPYISMHGSTKIMVDFLVEALAERGVTVKRFDLAVTDIGKLAMALVDAATIVLGVPTVLAGAHPLVAYATFLANALRPKTKFLGIIGSYGWGGRAVEQLCAMVPNIKAEVLEPVLANGYPKEADFTALEKLAELIAEKHAGLSKV